MSKPTMPDNQPLPANVTELIHHLHRTGQLDRILASPTPSGMMTGEVPTGGMHDGSKRRLFHEDEEPSESGFEVLHDLKKSTADRKQKPIPPFAASQAASSAVELPQGVSSVTEWGMTICSLKKVSDRRLRYHELVSLSSSEEAIKDYLKWIKHTGTRSAKVDDLRNYMKAVNFDPDQKEPGSQVMYPGTTIPREF